MRAQSSGLFAACLGLLVMVLSALPVLASGRIALVIGNSNYAGEAALRNPANDARDMAAKLGDLGFEVIDGYDLDLDTLDDTVRDFAALSRDAEVAIFYYAGHGIADASGQNYLVPIGAELRHEDDIEFETYPVDRILSYAKRANNASLIFLDACRNFPILASPGERAAPNYRTLGRIVSGPGRGTTGTVIAYATEPGNVAQDGTGRNSPFTRALLAHLGTAGADFAALTSLITRDVMAATADAQRPHFDMSLNGPLVLNPAAPRPAPGDHTLQDQRFLYELAVQSNDLKDFETYLRYFPDGVYADFARNAIARLNAPNPQQQVLPEATLPPALVDRLPEVSTPSPTDLPLILKVTETLRAAPASSATEAAIGLNRAKKLEIQLRLNLSGLEAGKPDGIFGTRSRRAISDWQTRLGLSATGYLNMGQLELLTAMSEPMLASHLISNPNALRVPRPVVSNVQEPEPEPTPSTPLELLSNGLSYIEDKLLGTPK